MANFCKNCGSAVTSDEKFCHNCGIALSSAEVQNPARKRTSDSKQLPKEPAVQKTQDTGRTASQDGGRTKFCRFCGNPVREGARFCRSCGQSLSADVSSQEPLRHVNTPTTKPGAGQNSRQTDLPIQSSPDDAPSKEQSLKTKQTKTRQTQKSSIRQPKKAASSTAVAAKEAKRKQNTMMPQINTQAAASTAGEIDLGVMTIPGLSNMSGAATKVLSPVSGIVHGIGSYLGGIFSIFKKPSALIGTILLAALWFVLTRLRGYDSEIVKTLSWLTYSEGGFNRSGLGVVGGVLGKGMVAAALISLLTGGVKKAVSGLGKLFKGSEKRSIFSIILGIVIGGTVYLFFVGPDNALDTTAMVGISCALLSLEALGSGSGKLYQLAQSLTSRSAHGVCIAEPGNCEGFLTGLTIGFALAAALSAFL